MPRHASAASQTRASSGVPEVTIVGDGIVALSVAATLARRGVSSRLIGAPKAGAASPAAAGAVDPAQLLAALGSFAQHSPRVEVARDKVAAVDLAGDSPLARTTGGTSSGAPFLVLAAGAWTPALRGLPRPVPIEPMRG